MREPESYAFPTLRARIAQLAAEGRHTEREAAAWLLAEVIMRGPVGFNPGRRAPRAARTAAALPGDRGDIKTAHRSEATTGGRSIQRR
jgi:hypothetical protein